MAMNSIVPVRCLSPLGPRFNSLAKPNVLVVTTGKVDNDAVLFKYGAQAWGSNDQEHHCNFGAYDSGNREGDCGFSC